MSESPKMGLFGSKDETKETKKEVKDDSPDRYAPYCIDSDSETYDTEALSIMDINDIIGVQSEPVSDSTLESEIAALSQMITESKTDTSQSATEIKYETTENELIKVDGVPMVENMDAVEVSDTSDRLTSTLEELEIVCSARETTSGCMEQLSKGNLQFNNENTLQESLQLCEERKDNDIRDNCEMNVLTESVAIVDSKDVENSDVISQTDGEFVQATSDSVSVTSDVVKSEENVNRPNANKQGDSNIKIATVNSEVTIIESENSIRGSLQLIGEAYSSEDSEDTIMNDEEPKETSSAISSNENSLISCEEKKDAFEVCEPQQDVNNVSDDINNISSNKICTEKDIADTIESEEVYSIEVDSSNCSTEPKHAEELLTISRETEDTKDIVPNECKVDSPSNIVSQCEEKEEDVNIAASDTNNVQEELMEEKKIDIQVIVEESVLEHSDMEVDEKDVELTSGTCATQESKCKVEVTEESTDAERDQKTAECMVVEEEGSSESEECISEKKGASSENEEPVNTLDIESNIASNDQVLSTESNDEVSADNDTKISEEKSELEIGIPETEIQSGSIDNFTSVELDKFESPQVTDNLDVSKDEVDEVELPEEKAEMEIEKLESLETEIKQDFLKPIASQLSPEVNDEIPVVSEEDSTSALQNSTEVSSYSDNLIDTTTNVADNIVTNVGVETEEKNSLDSVPSEIIKVDLKEDVAIESVDTAELSIIQEKSEDELKTCTLESCDTTFKCKDPMEVDSNEDSVTSALGTDTTSVVTQPADVTYEESSEDKTAQPLEEIDDKKAEEMEITNVQITQDENGIVEKESQESNEIESTIVEETELDKPLDVADVITEYTESKEMEISEQHEDLKIEKATEEITIEEQVEEENIIERKAEEKVTVEKEATEEEITVEKEIVEEEVTVEKEIAEEEVTVEKHIEEKITGEKETEEEITAMKEAEKENMVEEQIEKDRREGSAPTVGVEEQLKGMNNEVCELGNQENICNPAEENHPEESEKNMIQNELDVKMDETTEYVNEEDSTSDSKFTGKNPFSLSDRTEVVVCKEDVEEEHIKEEMNLTLEPEDTQSQSEMVKSDIDEKSENEKDMEFSEEIIKEDQEDTVVKMDEDTVDSLGIEKSSAIEIDTEEPMKSGDVEDSESNRIEELSEKQQLEDDDSKNDTNKDNLKDILETANNVEELFTEEQCQNTQDIVTSILDNIRSDFKNILSTKASVTNEIKEVLQQSGNLPLVEGEIEELTEKLPQDSEDILNKDMEDTMSTQNIDSLEGLLGLDLMPDGEDSTLKSTKSEEQLEKPEQLSKVVDMSLLLEQSNHEPSDMAQDSDYITHVISSCLNENTVPLEDNIAKSDGIEDDKPKEAEASDMLKVDQEDLIPESMEKDENVEDLQKDLREDTDLPENELDMDFEEAPLESVGDLEETESKLELAQDILLQSVDEGENLNDTPPCVETSQPSSEISELESAVKFLQESEEQGMDSPLILSPKLVESVVDDISKQADSAASLFVPDEDMCENASELEAELQNIATDSISISEAEIISEAAKLESERKLAEQVKLAGSENKFETTDDREMRKDEEIAEEKMVVSARSESKFGVEPLQNVEIQETSNLKCEKILAETAVVTLSQKVLKTSECIPKVSILEERLKEPPKIEIPAADVTKVTMSPTTSKDSLLIQKDAKLIAYQKMLESPKLTEKQSEPKIMETPRKDSEKHDFENVGSPRIILKIAKSAIADCGEPRSPKSPKIRSATNSPNPEDSPGQKLGKIKLKLSKSGHPSIISNENIEEVGQWYSEGSSSLSPIGMKIKLSKSGDASIVSSEKHDSVDDSKEGKHKFEEIKRTESPIGMKIKLSKTGDASIVQQEMQMKHKEKLDIVQGSPKRTESPIGMKIKLSKTGDASIIQPERQDYPEEYKDNAQIKQKEKHESCYDSPKRTDSPIGMKIKLSKTGDASIVSPDLPGEDKDACKTKEKLESPPDVPKRTESPIGMKIKLAKTKGGASIISMENSEEAKDKLEVPDVPKRTESPLGMKIKLSKSGDASIVHLEVSDEYKEKVDVAQDAMKSSESPSGMKIKVIKSGETSSIAQETAEETVESVQDPLSKVESPIGMKIKLYKFGDPSIISSEKQQEQLEEGKPLQEIPKRTESPLGMKIKLSKTGDASIIQPESSDDTNKMLRTTESEHFKPSDTCLGMKIKLSKTGDASIVDPEKKDRQQRRRDTESPLEMKIKLSKTGHPTIVACDNQAEPQYKPKEATAEPSQNFTQRYKESAGQQTAGHKESSTLKMFKSGSHSAILQSNRSELTIEPVQMQGKKPENVVEISPKRKDITIAPIESKKSKLEAQLTQILPEVTIQPVTSREQQKQFLFDPKGSAISLQQMNVINQEISITQVRPTKPSDASMSEKLKDILSKNTATNSPLNSDCEIIEHRPELIIVNENSNSSQDVVIIEEVSPNRMPEVKVPKKRGRPRRNPLQQGITHPPPNILIPRGPLSLDEAQQMQQPQVPHFPQSRENERPKRTCRSQKSYAPPRRGRGRGRGKRKLDSVDPQVAKKPRLEQDLNAIEASTTAVIMIDNSGMQQGAFGKSPELYKALKQPTMDSKVANSSGKVDKKIMGQKNDGIKNTNVANNTVPDSVATQTDMNKIPEMRLPRPVSNDSKDGIKDKKLPEIIPERMQKVVVKTEPDKTTENVKSENKDMLVPPGHPNWLTPMSKRVAEGATKHENVSTVQVIDEETRMSAESGSRSQTPARNISAPASETIVNEESQGSVLSTATTESEKVKVKNRRMEINFDPDEGPFTVDKIAEYEWPLDRKGETFMIQEQISQYLGVKSFKRKYPDLKRRVVDMEERNYLRENGLVSEAMCDMGLTAVCSSEVLDVMCSDFPDQYEEYRKHMREKQVKEHSKKQKELTAAANAEKNRIDLAEMAVQSALSWNISLNKARRENRKCSLDLQTFTIHVPKKQQKIETERRIGHYPVALIPGQYTDYYREYTPAELRYYPLNTVLYGPMRPNERKFDSQSEGSQSDSDSDSSSDDSSSSSSEGTQDTEGSQSTMDEVDMEIANQKDEIKLKCKMCLKTLNKHSKTEVLIQCGTCNGHVHPSCIDLTLDMVPHIQSYSWQCTDCKTCAQCHDPADEDKMLFCDMCDRGYHIYCVGLRRVPQGRWHCQECAVCANCGSREPGGVNSDRNSVALWQHEYKKGDKNTRVYVSTLCVPCSKLWRKGRYCPHCSRCHTAPRLDLEANLVHCSACDKYLHLGCVETKGVPLDRKNYLCDFCAPNRQQMMKPLISKTLRT